MKLDENFEKMVNGIFKASDKQALEYVHFYIESF